MRDFEPRLLARSLIESGSFSILGIWIQYWALGGSADTVELEAFIHGIPLLKGVEVDVLAAALEELPHDA